MTRKWTKRLLALGGLALALGCRSHPVPPPCPTPLMPDDLTKQPAPVAAIPPHVAGAHLPTGPGIQPPAPFTKLPDARQPAAVPSTSPDASSIRPPADVTPLLTETPKPTLAPIPRTVSGPVPAPLIKPLLVDPPKPPPGPDGFAPAPILGVPDPLPTAPAPAKPEGSVVKPVPLKPGEKLGHAADYKWVSGVLDYHQKGAYWTLRYADSGDDDPWGGKVRILADDRLASFASGDVVYLEGELLAPRSAAETATYPPYRVTDVRLIDKGR